jgi:uncharacterized protein with PQ loop repeat
MEYADLLGTAGTILSVTLYLAPFPAVYYALKTHTLDHVSFYYILLAHISPMSFAIYGLIVDN